MTGRIKDDLKEICPRCGHTKGEHYATGNYPGGYYKLCPEHPERTTFTTHIPTTPPPVRPVTLNPKFQIDTIVCFRNEWSSNPSYKTITIGKVVSINLSYGPGMFREEKVNKITYNIKGHSLGRIAEEELFPISDIDRLKAKMGV